MPGWMMKDKRIISLHTAPRHLLPPSSCLLVHYQPRIWSISLCSLRLSPNRPWKSYSVRWNTCMRGMRLRHYVAVSVSITTIAVFHLYNQWISWETSSLSLLPAQSQLSAVMLSTLQTRLRKTCNPGGVKTLLYNLINDMWCLQWLNGRSSQHMSKC